MRASEQWDNVGSVEQERVAGERRLADAFDVCVGQFPGSNGAGDGVKAGRPALRLEDLRPPADAVCQPQHVLPLRAAPDLLDRLRLQVSDGPFRVAIQFGTWVHGPVRSDG